MGVESVEDVDGFLTKRKDPVALNLEAEQLLEIQSGLGISFDDREGKPVARMIELEVRDRDKLEKVKRSLIRELVSKEKIDFLAIQETKLELVSDSLCFSLWGGEDCSWVFTPSQGRSGGVLSIWRKSSSSLIFSFSGEGFIGVCLEWGVHKKKCFVVNIYSKCDLPDKRRLWESLIMAKGGLGGGAWCVVGDWNSVLHREERRGVNEIPFSSYSAEIAEFQAFVDSMELEDLPVLGRKFTWFHPNGRTMSRIDRAFISDEWISSWGNPSLWAFPF
ncbi:endonuclease/exonuclease/phosphatase family protein [Trifolium medium]|uniref:Endonuclease/exonuclease/phosphatase family protein n=1 Tax=Trifolium medium TaxID=97028 RepID=A0A392NA14_9FABA|nr:endonuclease/exonuclease/phosphatase family protein [Trifolium medium]